MLRTLAIGLFIVVLGRSVMGTPHVKYGLGEWPETGRGNHRAILRVAKPADAVRAHIEWRRRDWSPEKKAILVFDSATGKQIANVVPIDVKREYGDIVFQPVTAPGSYEVYYLPYNPGKGNFDDAGTYFPPNDTANPEWKRRIVDWKQLPEAELIEIQARGDFNRMDPMEVIATSEETAALLANNPTREYLLFTEYRGNAIRMISDLPLKWIDEGPRTSFSGTAQPGEYYPFQIGVWAARRDIANLTLKFHGLTTGVKSIPASAMDSINLTGSDWLGRPIRKSFAVGKGTVRPLWIGVQIPRSAKGLYKGTIDVKPVGLPASTVAVEVKVAGPMVANGGVDDLWRLSRLKWLNSKLGLEDEVIPPYTPMAVNGSVVKCLDRAVAFNEEGLPVSIVSRGHELLAAPVAFIVKRDGRAISVSSGKWKVVKKNHAAVEMLAHATAAGFSVATRSRMEFDGCLSYTISMKAESDANLNDIRLEMPFRKSAVPYSMGFGRRGGFRPTGQHWKWNADKADNQIWLGDVNAGAQLTLKPEKDVWDVVTLHDAGLPKSWCNDSKGGCDVQESDNKVVVRAYSGSRSVKAGETLTFRFRLLITPFKPIDKAHWNWRYGDPAGEANILHIHHATPENPYINYPFRTVDLLAKTIKQTKSLVKKTDFGSLAYPANNIVRIDRGCLHLWTRINFDPKAGKPQQAQFNQNLFSLAFPNDDELGFYWNIDVRGMRAYVRRGSPSNNVYPAMADASSPEWKQNERHLLTLSWGDRLEVFVDGKLRGFSNCSGLPFGDLKKAVLGLKGAGFGLQAVKICDQPFAEGVLPTRTADAHTLLLDDFTVTDRAAYTKPRVGPNGKLAGTIKISGTGNDREMQLSSRQVPGNKNGVNLYYTVRELSNHAAEMWPLRSLGDEVFQSRETFIYSVEKTMFGQAGGGYPWLQEHLVTGYVPAWRQPLSDGEMDAAIGTQGLSRWHNYYVEGMRWLMEHTGLDGLYLDGIGYDREIMKRIARVMQRANPNYRINFHSGDNYGFMDWRVSPANSYMEHFPYISNLWFGEMYDYNLAPDYWLVEISGIPFGLTSEMLNYETGGNPYRGMVYGMTGRQHPSAVAMWRFWDSFGIKDADWLGYWVPNCPVRTDSPNVMATVYRKKGKSLISLAHWPGKFQRRNATAKMVSSAPVIDGAINSTEWANAAHLTDFTLHGQESPAKDQTEAYVAWDSERLYVAYRCHGYTAALKASVTSRDGSLWEDDAVELFIQPNLDKTDYVQFIGNSIGTFYDGKGPGNGTWNGDWIYKASVHDGYWEGEVSVSWASLGTKAPNEGTTFGINLCRDQQTPASAASCWSAMSAGFHNPGQFGRLRFTRTEPSTRQETEQIDPARQPVNVHLKLDWKALGLDPSRAKMFAPAIDHFQPYTQFKIGDEISIEPGKGWLIEVTQ